MREFSHEKSFAPEGKTVLQTMVVLDERSSREFVRLKNNAKLYYEHKIRLANYVKKCVCDAYPELKKSLELIDCWTPATYKRYTATEIGSFMSFAFGGGILPLKSSLKVRGAKNVVLASQWLKAPGGLPIAAECGKKAVEYLVRAEKKKTAPTRSLSKRKLGYSE